MQILEILHPFKSLPYIILSLYLYLPLEHCMLIYALPQIAKYLCFCYPPLIIYFSCTKT